MPKTKYTRIIQKRFPDTNLFVTLCLCLMVFLLGSWVMALRSNAITSKALGPSGKREGEERERERESKID